MLEEQEVRRQEADKVAENLKAGQSTEGLQSKPSLLSDPERKSKGSLHKLWQPVDGREVKLRGAALALKEQDYKFIHEY